jgi:hypothetical protein
MTWMGLCNTEDVPYAGDDWWWAVFLWPRVDAARTRSGSANHSGVLLKHSLATDQQRNQQAVREQRQRLQQRLSTIRQRLDQAYLDKLDGKIDAPFWECKSAEWWAEEQQVT